MLLPLQLNNLLAVADTTAPILSLPTGESTGSTTASGTVTTDEAGTLYYWATENATENDTDIEANGDTHVATTGIQNISSTGLTPATGYYYHYFEIDAASNRSNVVSSGLFTTSTGEDPNPAQREAVAGGALGRSNRRKKLIARDNEDLLDIIKAAMPEIAKYL